MPYLIYIICIIFSFCYDLWFHLVDIICTCMYGYFVINNNWVNFFHDLSRENLNKLCILWYINVIYLPQSLCCFQLIDLFVIICWLGWFEGKYSDSEKLNRKSHINESGMFRDVNICHTSCLYNSIKILNGFLWLELWICQARCDKLRCNY